MNTEHWPIGGGESYFYTDDRDLASRLRKRFPYATYSRVRGNPFAWQFRLKTRLIRIVLQERVLKNKDLRESGLPNLRQEERSPDTRAEDAPPCKEDAPMAKMRRE